MTSASGKQRRPPRPSTTRDARSSDRSKGVTSVGDESHRDPRGQRVDPTSGRAHDIEGAHRSQPRAQGVERERPVDPAAGEDTDLDERSASRASDPSVN